MWCFPLSGYKGKESFRRLDTQSNGRNGCRDGLLVWLKVVWLVQCFLVPQENNCPVPSMRWRTWKRAGVRLAAFSQKIEMTYVHVNRVINEKKGGWGGTLVDVHEQNCVSFEIDIGGKAIFPYNMDCWRLVGWLLWLLPCSLFPFFQEMRDVNTSLGFWSMNVLNCPRTVDNGPASSRLPMYR